MARIGSEFRPSRWLALLTALLAGALPAAAQTVESFYRGKTIELIIGYPPGGANDVYARLAARHLGKHIPGSPTILPKNMPGAGSVVAANHIYNLAARDGATLGLLVPTLPLEEALGSPTAKYKSAGFGWIGRMAPAPNVTFIMARAPVKRIADAFDTVAVLGATGKSATNAVYPAVLNNVLGTKFKIVTGYEGAAAAVLAMERGEIDGHSSTYDTLKTLHQDWIRDGSVNVVVQYMLKRHAELPDVPTSVELARTPEQASILAAVSSASEIGKFLLTTPGTPPERVTALRRAFDAMSRDHELRADADKAHVEIGPLPGEDLQKIVEQVVSLPPDIVAKVRAIYPLN
jgi:tripartite-type tricarboxylate transporter receptor subunit TctC